MRTDPFPNDQQALQIDRALEEIYNKRIFPPELMQIDHSTVRLQEGYKHMGIGGSTTAFGGNIIIDPITADGNHATNLMADLVGELEHYPPPFGLGMDEPDAEIHFHEVFLPKMGWQNSYLTNQHHYGQNYPYNPTPTKGH